MARGAVRTNVTAAERPLECICGRGCGPMRSRGTQPDGKRRWRCPTQSRADVRRYDLEHPDKHRARRARYVARHPEQQREKNSRRVFMSVAGELHDFGYMPTREAALLLREKIKEAPGGRT